MRYLGTCDRFYFARSKGAPDFVVVLAHTRREALTAIGCTLADYRAGRIVMYRGGTHDPKVPTGPVEPAKVHVTPHRVSLSPRPDLCLIHEK